MKEANQQLQHNISVSHQIINSECRVLEMLLKRDKLTNEDILESVKIFKGAVKVSKEALNKHYTKTGVPINAL